ncbi:DUF1003 domain-containing protein [Streptomyces sp. NBC_00243]|uniref:DUF1003 domain-containing protein n=1 Tax=Streptomyces sp. NBC_00243 TaxID=2975688 RepID=UPI002DD98C80|nr:DUF1003 domain-containing protein [Streptomyces sp. NBC_00243]WRZ24643.1 DUF1003 domain-containing protein [Streptomyces sp. NBC_00243]
MAPEPSRLDVRLPNERAVLARMRGTQDRIADAITAFAGTMQFVYIHAAWFAVWIVVNEGLFGESAIWDPFPFGLLTMIVSLEAIFLSTFVMVSQNRQALRENVRADLDFETNVRSEVWAAHIGQALGVDAKQVEEAVQVFLAQNRAKMNGTEQSPQKTP